MIHMILVILKIAGWILLAAAGLLLAALLAVLFVPVRYRAEGKYFGQLSAGGRISWCLGIVSLRLSYEDGEPSARLRIAGISVGGDREEPEWEEPSREEAEREEPSREEREPEIHTASLDGEASPRQDREEKTERKKEKRKPTEKGSSAGGKEKRFSVLRRLKKAAGRLQRRAAAAAGRFRELLAKKEKFLEMLRDEKNRKTFRLVKRQLGKVLRHVRPRKAEGKLIFGFDDPYRTGQALEAAALLCPLYKNSLRIVPVFDRSVLEGELKFKGRIRLWTLVSAALRLLMDGNFRKLAGKLMNR